MKARTMLGIFGPIVFAIACAQSDPGITTKVKSQLIADDARPHLLQQRNRLLDVRPGLFQRAAFKPSLGEIVQHTELKLLIPELAEDLPGLLEG